MKPGVKLSEQEVRQAFIGKVLEHRNEHNTLLKTYKVADVVVHNHMVNSFDKPWTTFYTEAHQQGETIEMDNYDVRELMEQECVWVTPQIYIGFE